MLVAPIPDDAPVGRTLPMLDQIVGPDWVRGSLGKHFSPCGSHCGTSVYWGAHTNLHAMAGCHDYSPQNAAELLVELIGEGAVAGPG